MSEYKRLTVVSLLSRRLRCWRAASQQLIDRVTLADVKLELDAHEWKQQEAPLYLIADLNSHVKLALPCELTRQKPPRACRFASTSNDHSISDSETELETFQGDTHISKRKDKILGWTAAPSL